MVAATVAHHRTPHKGNEMLFWHGELVSSCKQCHDSMYHMQEASGIEYDTAIGHDGMPIDPKHPFYHGQ